MKEASRAALSGSRGEDVAERLLLGLGYRVLARNFRTRSGEIDIVAEDVDTIVFVEVKRRESTTHGRPEEFISSAKIRRVISAARIYAARYGLTERKIRFDVIAVEPRDGGDHARHFKSAFTT